ncbi:MAG: VWA domain-containing protein [Planctomycetales bacterium]|nr:VWA domain-containing protein [Planctomycetales bacterium]
MSNSFPRPYAAPLKTQADIVFCLDATGSMEHCLSGVLNGMDAFARDLASICRVDARFRLIAFRDYHSPDCRTPWNVHEFTTAEEFSRQLRAVKAGGGGDEPESVFDAMYMALKSDWRPNRTHKSVIVMTDADTHPNLHERTSNLPANGLSQIIQLIQETRHLLLFMVAPKFPAYAAIERAANEAFDANRKIMMNWVPRSSEGNRGLQLLNFQPLMEMISGLVSATSVDIALQFEDEDLLL